MIGKVLTTNYERAVYHLGGNLYRNYYMSTSITTISNCCIYNSETNKVTKAYVLDIQVGDTVVVHAVNKTMNSALIIR